MSIRTARGTSLSTSSRNTVTSIPHDFKFNSEWTLLYISLSSLAVCSLLVSGFQATVRIHFRLNSISTELSSIWNFKRYIIHKVRHTLRTIIAPILTVYFFSDRTRGFIIATPQLLPIITKLTLQLIHSMRYVTNFSLLSAMAGFSTTTQQLYHTYIMHHTG
jgi:hypothetical protein